MKIHLVRFTSLFALQFVIISSALSENIITPTAVSTANLDAFGGTGMAQLVDNSGMSTPVNTGAPLSAALLATHTFDGGFGESYVSNDAAPVGGDYFADSPTKPTIIWDLSGGGDIPLTRVIFWQYQNNGGGTDVGNQVREIALRFNTEAQGSASFTGPEITLRLQSVLGLGGTNSAQSFLIGRTSYRYVEMRFVDNHFGNPDEEGVTGGGAHVGLGELRFASRDILTIARVNASTFELDWSSQSNRYYRLLSTLDLSQGMPSWDVVVSGILGTPPTNSVQVAAPEIGMRSYYRVEEQPPPSVIPELVEVGNPNNVADFNVTTILGNSGAVPYVYSIGKYEVTNAEYVEFLNGVDPNGLNATFLYNSSMSSSSVGGITFTVGNVDGQKYAVKPGFARKPVVFVSYFDAMRFCNWLHNGVQTGGDTENGAYTLLPPLDPSTGAPSNAGTVVRNAGAKFVVPTEDEWYKAAYHQPQAQGGDTDNYWFYPTGGNSVPNANNPPGTAPAANFDSVVGSVTDVGAYTTTEGFYGTFDMAGNVSEWIETRLSSSSSSHVLRGGSWGFRVNVLRPTGPSSANPEFQDFNIGFRISSP